MFHEPLPMLSLTVSRQLNKPSTVHLNTHHYIYMPSIMPKLTSLIRYMMEKGMNKCNK